MCIRDRPYLLTCALIAVLFPRASVSAGTSVMLEMSAGVLLFSGVFLITDPVTAPRHWLARIVYGMAADVYKRQDMQRLVGRSTAAVQRVRATPVSYTHLDVYKRQVEDLLKHDKMFTRNFR